MIAKGIIIILYERYIDLILIFIFISLVLIYFIRFENFITRFFQRLSQKLPEPVFLASSLMIILLFSLIIFLLLMPLFPPKEYEEDEEYEVAQQIEKLDEMQNSLEDLQNLISTQKENLINTEKYVELLKMEKQKLEPIVKANRELVESILTLQKERTMSQVWKDRFIGFVISVLAGLVIIIFRNFWKSWKS